MRERWKKCRKYPGYEASDQGRVRSVKRAEPKVRKVQMKRTGYMQVTLWIDGRSVAQYVHRLIARAWCRGYKPGLQVNHKNGDRTDNRACNLQWVTARQNNQHRVKRKKRNARNK